MLAVSWQDFLDDARRLVDLLRPRVGVDIMAIYGIPRGGLVLATYLSHALNLPMYLPGVPPGTDVIIVDDNVITGETLETYVNRGYTTAALIVNPFARFVPTFFVRTSPDWPIFPWEVDGCAEMSK